MRDVGAFEERNVAARRAWGVERRIRHVVRAPDPIVLDVGAHIGQSNELFRRLFPTATIWSFEPDPDSFARLVAGVDPSLPGGCVQVALSDRDGTAVLHRNPISHTNSLHARNRESRDSIDVARLRAEGGPIELEVGTVEVPLARLDTWCAANAVDHVDLLKIDVQGAEVAVLRGATATLPTVRTVVVEISFFDVYERSSSFLEVESLLAPSGHRLYALAEVSDNPMNGRTDWVTAVYTLEDFRELTEVDDADVDSGSDVAGPTEG